MDEWMTLSCRVDVTAAARTRRLHQRMARWEYRAHSRHGPRRRTLGPALTAVKLNRPINASLRHCSDCSSAEWNRTPSPVGFKGKVSQWTKPHRENARRTCALVKINVMKATYYQFENNKTTWCSFFHRRHSNKRSTKELFISCSCRNVCYLQLVFLKHWRNIYATHLTTELVLVVLLRTCLFFFIFLVSYLLTQSTIEYASAMMRRCST